MGDSPSCLLPGWTWAGGCLDLGVRAEDSVIASKGLPPASSSFMACLCHLSSQDEAGGRPAGTDLLSNACQPAVQRDQLVAWLDVDCQPRGMVGRMRRQPLGRAVASSAAFPEVGERPFRASCMRIGTWNLALE